MTPGPCAEAVQVRLSTDPAVSCTMSVQTPYRPIESTGQSELGALTLNCGGGGGVTVGVISGVGVATSAGVGVTTGAEVGSAVGVATADVQFQSSVVAEPPASIKLSCADLVPAGNVTVTGTEAEEYSVP